MSTKLSDMRILMFTRTMAMGGTEKVVLQLCRVLNNKVAFLGVMSCGGELLPELDAMGVPHFGIPDITDKNPATYARVSSELKKVVRENGVSLVHCHHRMAALYCHMALPAGVRAVATAHNVFSGGRVVTRFLYKGMRVAACGGRVYENLVGYYGLPDDMVKLVPNGVPGFDGGIVQIPAVTGCAKGVLKIGFVGRLSEQKGAEYLVDAMGILAERGVHARCFLVGDGELEGELRERARRSAAVNDIVFLGRREDPQNFLSQVDICAMPSLWEGLPLVLLEALSVGVPVVASACDGILDVLRDGDNGLLVTPADAGALAAALELLCNDASLRDRLGAKGRSDYEKEYSFETWRERYLDFYREAML